MITLQNQLAEATVDLHGGLITSWKHGGIDILYPDRRIEGKRRGGIPFLFPNSGKLTRPEPYPLPQHGFARDRRWRLQLERSDQMVAELVDSPETRVLYPFSFRLLLTVQLRPYALYCQVDILNQGAVPLPVAPGFHPYFALGKEQRSHLQLSIPQFRKEQFSWDETLAFPRQEIVRLGTSQYEVELTSSSQCKKVMVWSQPQADFICVEPWVGGVDALLGPEALWIAPAATLSLWLQLGVSNTFS